MRIWKNDRALIFAPFMRSRQAYRRCSVIPHHVLETLGSQSGIVPFKPLAMLLGYPNRPLRLSQFDKTCLRRIVMQAVSQPTCPPLATDQRDVKRPQERRRCDLRHRLIRAPTRGIEGSSRVTGGLNRRNLACDIGSLERDGGARMSRMVRSCKVIQHL
jgi:hypothetical protein